MAKSFMQMAKEAMAQVEGIGAEEVQQRLKQDPNALLVDVRDASRDSIHRPSRRWGERASRSLATNYYHLPARPEWRKRSKTS